MEHSSSPFDGITANGDDLQLYVTTYTTTYNDLPDLHIGHLTIDEGAVNGNSLTVTKGILATNNASVTVTFNCPLVFPVSQTIEAFTDLGTFTENTIYLHFNGPISVTGGTLTLQAEGTTFNPARMRAFIYPGRFPAMGTFSPTCGPRTMTTIAA